MKTRWYYGIVILIFAVIGIYQNNTQIPNQQIVIQFGNSQISIDDAIERVKLQLQDIGASQVKIENYNSEQLTITYYSGSDVSTIKEFLSQENFLVGYEPVSGTNDHSTEHDDSKTIYKFDVSELQNKNYNWDFEGTLIVEFKEHLNRSLSTDSFSFFSNLNNENVRGISKYGSKVIYHSVKQTSNTSHNIPEVRAGPIG